MIKVGICNQCNNTAIAGCRVETDDESIVLEDMEASNDIGPVQFDTENEMVLRRPAKVKATELEGVREGIVGPWELRDIANMDQTPLQYRFNTKGATYAERGEKSVWTLTTGEGHDKRQCTILTIFADGEPRIKPMLIF